MSDELYEERRKWKRRHLVYYLKIFNAESGEKIGNLVDITAGGMMLVSGSSMAENQTLRICVELPEEVLQKDNICFTAETRWSKMDVNPDLYVTGFEITDITQEDLAVIDSLIRRHGFRD